LLTPSPLFEEVEDRYGGSKTIAKYRFARVSIVYGRLEDEVSTKGKSRAAATMLQ